MYTQCRSIQQIVHMYTVPYVNSMCSMCTLNVFHIQQIVPYVHLLSINTTNCSICTLNVDQYNKLFQMAYVLYVNSTVHNVFDTQYICTQIVHIQYTYNVSINTTNCSICILMCSINTTNVSICTFTVDQYMCTKCVPYVNSMCSLTVDQHNKCVPYVH